MTDVCGRCRAVRDLLRPRLRPGSKGRPRQRSSHGGVEQTEGDRWQAFMGYLTDRAARSDVKQSMRQIPRGNLGPIIQAELEAIRTPTALIWGQSDHKTRLRTAQQAAQSLDWPLHVITQAGHIPHLEQPAAFIEELRYATDATKSSNH